MSPQFVKPYVKSNKNDRNDAQAIAEAVTRPNMKFVPKKTEEQQENLLLHRARELLLKQRTALSNQIRGFLAEFGVVITPGIARIKEIRMILDKNKEELPEGVRQTILNLSKFFKKLTEEIEHYEKKINMKAKTDVRCKAIMEIEGVGPVTATAIVSTLGDPSSFKNGREASAWLGLVPKQYSSGNKIRLGGISKRGDNYIRKLLVHGARSVLKYCDHKKDDSKKNRWIFDKKNQLGWNKAAVALANKQARVIWAMLSTGESYRKTQYVERVL